MDRRLGFQNVGCERTMTGLDEVQYDGSGQHAVGIKSEI